MSGIKITAPENERLLKHEEDSKMEASSSLLHKAALAGQSDALNSLLESACVNVNQTDDAGNTALYTSVSAGHLEASSVLLERGARVDVANRNGDTVLHLAAREDRCEIFDTLVKYANSVDIRNKVNETPLHVAAARGHSSICEKLCCHGGADLNIPTDQQNTPLHLALKRRHIKTAMQLIKLGAKLDVQDVNGDVPLHLASDMSSVDAALVKELVIKAESQLVARNKCGNTPLHVAAAGGHFKAVEYFVDHSVQVNVPNLKGDTPLHLAADGGFPVTAKMIIKANLEVLNKKNSDGKLAIFKSAESGKTSTLKMFLEVYAHQSELWEEYRSESRYSRPGLLEAAVNGGHEEAALEMVKSSFWQEFMLDEWYERGGTVRVTPFRQLIKNMPKVAQYTMDKCIRMEKHSIVVQYEILDDMYCHWNENRHLLSSSNDNLLSTGNGDIQPKPYTTDRRVLRKNHPMKIIVDCNREELMDHPLLSALLRRKWKIAVFCYILFLMYYIIFVASFSTIMITTPPPFYNNSCAEVAIPEILNKSITASIRHPAMNGVVYALSGIGMIVEIIQLILLKPASYMKFHNLFDWFTYIAPIVVVTSFNSCNAVTDWQWQLGVACLFISYMNLLFFLRIIPALGIYIMMIILMLQNFLQFFTIMLLFIVSFAVCFFLLTQNHVPFSNVYLSVMKNYVMMVGEMDFDSLFMAQHQSYDDSDQLHYEALTWLLFITFLVFMSLVMMNLLTSLAVQGIDSLLNDSKYRVLSLQIKISLEIEFALPEKIHRAMNYVVQSQHFQKPQEQTSKLSKFWGIVERSLLGSLCKAKIYKNAYQVLHSVAADDDENLVKQDITVKDIDNSVGRKTKEMRKHVKDIDRNVELIQNKVIQMENDMKDLSRKIEVLLDVIEKRG